MNKFWIKTLFSLGLLFVFGIGLTLDAAAQPRSAARGGNRQQRDLANRIRIGFDNFRASFDAAIQNVRLRGTDADNIYRYIEEFETAFDNYDARLSSRTANAADARPVLDAATRINGWLRITRLNTRVERDWATVKLQLNQLARDYNVSWNQDSVYNPNYPTNSNDYPRSSFSSRLTGTFRLDESRSDNPRDVADRTIDDLPFNQQERARQTLEQRLETPQILAIEQRNRQITIASTRASRYTFEADGRDKYEQSDNGSNLRVRASLIGEKLEVLTSGDRGNDYTVMFEPFDAGRSLRVTRRLSTDYLRLPVVVTSVYARFSDSAQLDVYERPNRNDNSFPGDNQYPGDNRYPNNNRGNGEFILRGDTTLRATLNDTVSTKTSTENQRFSMTVQTPAEYRGAIIEGYLTGIKRSGRVSGRANLTFNFETIRLNDGRTYSFNGFVESVRNSNGDEVKIDNEGTAQGGNQTKQTATRGAIGAGVGAIIGAIAGGGKGAAIGAIIGGGAGAGSVYIEGREDLEINTGSDVYIRASAPNRNSSRY